MLPSRNQRKGIVVRVTDHWLLNVAGSEPMYRLITTILGPKQAPAAEIAVLNHERWAIEASLDELKTYLAPGGPLGSSSPWKQESLA